MSSSNTCSILDFTSSSRVLLPILPSVSELLAHERFTNLIRPCLKYILKSLQRIHPLSNLIKILYQYKDEFLLIIESILQWIYLHSHSALIGEHLYGLKRTANHRLRSIIFSVFFPYIKIKLDLLQKDIQNNKNNKTNYPSSFYLLVQILPKIQVRLFNYKNKIYLVRSFYSYLSKVYLGSIE